MAVKKIRINEAEYDMTALNNLAEKIVDDFNAFNYAVTDFCFNRGKIFLEASNVNSILNFSVSVTFNGNKSYFQFITMNNKFFPFRASSVDALQKMLPPASDIDRISEQIVHLNELCISNSIPDMDFI
jgi:hypothetical protein